MKSPMVNCNKSQSSCRRNIDPQSLHYSIAMSSEVRNNIQYAPNFDAKSQTGMESAMTKVGPRVG